MKIFWYDGAATFPIQPYTTAKATKKVVSATPLWNPMVPFGAHFIR